MNSIDKLFIADTQIVLPDTFLEKVDKSTMAHSIEIRVPFLDTELTDYVMSLPAELKVKNGEKKYLLKQSLRGIVPDSILDGLRQGLVCHILFGYRRN
jgi:asparagine synthase (glutamine-hydrolysing)